MDFSQFEIHDDATGGYGFCTRERVERSKVNRVNNTDNGNNNSKGAKNKKAPQDVDTKVVCLIILYIVIFTLLLLYSIVQLWPASISTGNGTPTSSPVTFLLWTFSISDESRMILIIAMAGSLGSLIHTFRSAIKYIGERKFVRSWLAFYILLPYIGAVLGLVFYFVIRGGFFSTQASVQQTSPFGFAALAGLVGMFSEQAIRKLKNIFEQLLTEAKTGADHYEETGTKNAESN